GAYRPLPRAVRPGNARRSCGRASAISIQRARRSGPGPSSRPIVQARLCRDRPWSQPVRRAEQDRPLLFAVSLGRAALGDPIFFALLRLRFRGGLVLLDFVAQAAMLGNRLMLQVSLVK